MLNQDEVDVDCGTAACGGCAEGARCSAGAGCESGRCGFAGACLSALVCGDGLRNGDEGDVDCGGSEPGCARCDNRQSCSVGTDCQSGRCSSGVCSSCSDGVQNGDEAGVDCGGSDPGCAACPAVCDVASAVDMGAVSSLTRLPASGCAKITQFPGYAPALIESWEFGPFPVGFRWAQQCSGQGGGGSFDRAYHQQTLSGLSTNCPVLFEFFGSDELLDVRWW